MTVLDRMRAPLYIERNCRHCGKRFRARNANAVYCSRAHQMCAWRAAKMLEGTHNYVGGLFRRVADAG
jgi:hypothetical protein